MVILKSKVTHKIKPTTGEEIDLYVVTSYDFGSDYAIVVNESATGDGGVVYNNGRLQEDIPISGIILANDLEDVKNKIVEIRKLADDKSVVEFIYPYKSDIRTNLFYIKSVRITPEAGKDNEAGFSITLTEKREANVKTTQVNLVNFASAESMLTIYNALTGI